MLAVKRCVLFSDWDFLSGGKSFALRDPILDFALWGWRFGSVVVNWFVGVDI